MYIGEILKSRMNALEIDAQLLADKSFVKQELIEEILDDRIDLENIDVFELGLISKSLYCDVDYFIDENVRNKDIIHSYMNRGSNDVKSNTVKGQLQVVTSDFIFLRQIIDEAPIDKIDKE